MFSKGTARWRRVCRSRCAIGRTRFAVRWRVGHGAYCRGLNSPVAPGSRRGHTPEPPHDFGNWSRLYDRWPIFSAVSTLRHWRKMGFDRSPQPPAICSIRIPPRIFPIRSLLRLAMIYASWKTRTNSIGQDKFQYEPVARLKYFSTFWRGYLLIFVRC